MDTIKACRKFLGCHFAWKINSHKDIIVAMIVFVPHGLVAIGAEPVADYFHPGSKIGGA